MTVHDGEIPQRLLEAATDAFARHGFASARVRDIVRAADASLASVNYYFGGKEGLYAATLESLASQGLAGRTASEPVPHTDPEEGLHDEVRALLRTFVEGEGAARLGRMLAHESMDPTPYFDVLVSGVLKPEVERLGAALARVARGSLDAETQQRCALGILGQCLFYLFARGAVERIFPDMPSNAERTEALARHITRFSLGGIVACGE